ncbi:hypothetical protein ACGFIV_33630 [Sphaerisporangium sp. NPDC049003]|uniref:hypothetical protein n=1 Tax=Sphaerisporangium sp. NPDC049003 TaxID=3364517 RepID=UPI00371217E6
MNWDEVQPPASPPSEEDKPLPPEDQTKRPIRARRRTTQPAVQSSKIGDDTNHRLTVYCAITKCGVKDAVVAAASFYLGLVPAPQPLPLDGFPQLPDEVTHQLRVISVRIEPSLKKQIADAADELSLTSSAWVDQALTEFSTSWVYRHA